MLVNPGTSATGDAYITYSCGLGAIRLVEAVRAAYASLVNYLLVTYYTPYGPSMPRELPVISFPALGLPDGQN